MRRFLIGFLALFAMPVAAQEDDPSFATALEAVAQEDWDTAYALVATEGPVARDLITWMRLRDGSAVFADYPVFLTRRADWPGLDRARLQAEGLIDETVSTGSILAFFNGGDVQTGEGAVAYANALIAEGRTDEAEAMLTRVWLENGLSESGFNAIISSFPEVVMPHHFARAEMLLWRWRTSDASRLLPHLDEGERALVRARMGYIGKAGDIDERVALVPQRLRDDPGLTYDRFNWLAERGDWTDAVELLQAQDSAEQLGEPWRWASWRRVLSRWQMREGNARTAYDLASRHHLSDGADYADLEWIAGYLSLRYLDAPDQALIHFERFRDAVSSPISSGRAGYWLGQAHRALGNTAEAEAAFQFGAQYQTAFYGLLSAEELGLELDPALVGGEVFDDWQEAEFLTNDKAQAALMLLGADERGLAVLFFADLAREMERGELGQLGQLLTEMDETFFALMVAKIGVTRDMVVQDFYFPIHGLAQMELPVETALALAIARQESEFRTDAGSSVGALGLMQLMPGTAREMAEATGLPFRRGQLTNDWEYNARLGSAYLAHLQEMFGESPVLIAVGYNAGPGRARQWIGERGDPRRGGMDVIDWIEHIPFRETRNYVMRVTEGIPVYRARLTGETGAIRFRDLLVGAPPVIRPVARPERDEAETVVGTQDTPPSPQGPTGPQPIRPISRP